MLVLGRQYKETSVVNASHAVELADAGITKDCDDFVRGWIGVGGAFLTAVSYTHLFGGAVQHGPGLVQPGDEDALRPGS